MFLGNYVVNFVKRLLKEEAVLNIKRLRINFLGYEVVKNFGGKGDIG